MVQSRRWRSLLVLAGLMLSLFGSPGSAQDLSGVQDITEIDLDDLLQIRIVTTKTMSALLDAPAVLVVVDREELRWWQYQSVGEVLEHIAGLDVVDDHMNQNVGVRGVSSGLFEDNSTIKVMVDGVSVAFRSASGNWLGLELVPMSAIERIEVIRGPASSPAPVLANELDRVASDLTLDLASVLARAT